MHQDNTRREWLDVAEPIIGAGAAFSTMLLTFTAFFGVDPLLCHLIWTTLAPSIITLGMTSSYEKKHLLWGLYFMRVYATERVMAATC